MIYCHDCRFRTVSNLMSEAHYCLYHNAPCENILGCECGESRIITNADRIRAMTDEELAVFLEEVADGCDSCPMLKECTYSDGEISEQQIRLKWLKQEAET